MAGQLKEVRNRIKSVQSTQQITKAMKMVSAAKLRRAQDSITQMRPYARKLQEMLRVKATAILVSMKSPSRTKQPAFCWRNLMDGGTSRLIKRLKAF